MNFDQKKQSKVILCEKTDANNFSKDHPDATILYDSYKINIIKRKYRIEKIPCLIIDDECYYNIIKPISNDNFFYFDGNNNDNSFSSVQNINTSTTIDEDKSAIASRMEKLKEQREQPIIIPQDTSVANRLNAIETRSNGTGNNGINNRQMVR